MSLFPGNVLEAGIKVLDSLIPGVKTTFLLEQFTGVDANGDETYAAPIDDIDAVVDYTNKVTLRNGQMVSISATLTILKPIPFNNTLTDPPRRNPIDPRDRITLPDGTTGKILSVPGAVNNPSTGTGFIQVVEIGPRR